MAEWYVKELSKLTGITVQCLHHYDRINLLKPSIRRPNGYRVYSEADLLKLQKIIALKFFGFELAKIKVLLNQEADALAHLLSQVDYLTEKANTLIDASKTLKNIIDGVNSDKSIPWETIIKILEVYRMTQQLQNRWEAKVLNTEELKHYAQLEADLKTRYTPEEKAAFEQNWANLVMKIKASLSKDPKSEFGMNLGKQVMDLINPLYGKQYAGLKKKLWEKGYKEGKAQEEHYIDPDVIAWMDKAIDAYYRKRIYAILDQITVNPTEKLVNAWQALMEDMYGNDASSRQDLVDAAQVDERVSEVARKWLKGVK